MLRKLVAMMVGFAATLVAINAWAGTFTPTIRLGERLTLDHTFYDQNTELSAVIHHIDAEQGPRVVGIGDSTMYGALVYANQTIPHYMQGQLQAHYPSVHVTNLAFPGARPADLYAVLKWASTAKPDLVVIDVNVVFFSQKILDEGALADTNLKKEFIFDSYVPHGIFTGSRIDAAVATLLQNTNIGQFKPEINKALFGGPLRDDVANLAKTMMPPQPTVDKPAKAPALPAPVIGQGWWNKDWNAAEVANMTRIYGQGAISPQNDSVRMLDAMVSFVKAHHIPTLFYMTPQNETLIGRYFSLEQLNANEDFLYHRLRSEGAWVIDLRKSAVSHDFGDYDHLLASGNEKVAEAVSAAILQKGVLAR